MLHRFESFKPRQLAGREEVKKVIYAKEIKLIDDFIKNWQANKGTIYETTDSIYGVVKKEGGGGLVQQDTQLQVTKIKRTGDIEGIVTVRDEENEWNWEFDLLQFAQNVRES